MTSRELPIRRKIMAVIMLTTIIVLLVAVATHRVGNRPDRVEPREVKRRRQAEKLMMRPRAQRRAELLAGIGV